MRGKRRQRRGGEAGLKRRLIKWVSVALGVLLLLVLALSITVNSRISKEYLIEEIEKSIKGDVEIGDVDVSIFSIPAKLTLTDVSLSSREAGDVNAEAPVRIEEVSLSVGLWGLLSKHIDVSNITIRGADITAVYREDGSTTLGELFDAPDEKKRKRGRDKSKDEEGSGFNIFDQEDFVATLGGLVIKDSRADITLESTGLRLRCTDVNLDLSSIKIDPKKLEETNSAKLELGGKIRLDSTDGRHYGDLLIVGKSTARLFNPQTGDAEPEIEGEFNLGDESWLNTNVPFVTKAWNHLSMLKAVGIEISKLPERATFGRSQSVAAHYHLGKVTVMKPLSIWLGDWEFAAIENSWLETQTDQHEISGELLASKGASVHFRSLISKGLNLIPEEARALVLDDLEGQLFRDERLLVKVQSTGDFSDPKIRPVGAIMDLSEAAKNAAQKLLLEKAGSLLDGFLGGGKDDED